MSFLAKKCPVHCNHRPLEANLGGSFCKNFQDSHRQILIERRKWIEDFYKKQNSLILKAKLRAVKKESDDTILEAVVLFLRCGNKNFCLTEITLERSDTNWSLLIKSWDSSRQKECTSLMGNWNRNKSGYTVDITTCRFVFAQFE